MFQWGGLAIRRLALLGAVLVGSAAAHAQLCQVTYTGNVLNVYGSGYDSTVTVGSKLSESFVIDWSMVQSNSDTTFASALYMSPEPPYSPEFPATALVGDFYAIGGITYLTMYNDNVSNGDGFTFGTLPDSFGHPSYFSASLESSNTNLWSDYSHPPTELPVSDFDKNAGMVLWGGSGTTLNQWCVYAPISSYTVRPFGVPVPESSTYGMVGGAAVIGLALLRLRRRK